MKRIFYISLFLTAATTSAQQTDVQMRWMDNSLLSRNMATVRYDNPAMMKNRYNASLTSVGASWLFDSQEQARAIEEGDGSNRADISAEAFIKKGKNDIWGEAGYSVGQRRNVLFNESSDYSRIYPYVTADLVGGDLHEETYRFSGGFAHTLKNGITLGASAGYKALLAYRTVDPRPRNLTSDLDFAVGMKWKWLDVALKAGKYKQTNVVKFYNETYQPTVYHATGLGTDYYRFRGTNTNTYYNGRDFGAQIGASSRFGKTEAGVVAAYDYFGFDKIISSLNELPMASVAERTYRITAYALFRPAQGHSIAIEANASRERRDGKENIFGEAENNIYPEIASLSMFRHAQTEATAKVSYEYLRKSLRLQLDATAGYATDRWRYTEPERRMEANHPIVGFDATLSVMAGRCTLSPFASVTAVMSSDAVWTKPETSQSVLDASAERQFEMIADTDMHYSVGLRADCRIKAGLGIFCRLAYDGKHYAGSLTAKGGTATIGLIF